VSPGQLVRRVLGPRLFKPLGRLYRSVFVDLDAVSASFPALPPNARVLEVGGGDGQMLSALLARFPDARATMIDVSAQLGGALEPAVRARVEVLPSTSMRKYAELGRPAPDLISVCDVVHHVPPALREEFFGDLARLLGPHTSLVIKDIRPGSPRARLSYLADRYISGDQQVSLIGEDALEALVKRSLPRLRPTRTSLIDRDGPNYAIVFSSD
jgi:2-polyprenyl-3-methyl-5-hydroxy-6-metoxy-1,4-benzoquinol methylase